MNFGFADHRSEGNVVLGRPISIRDSDRVDSVGSIQTFGSYRSSNSLFPTKGTNTSVSKSITVKSEQLGKTTSWVKQQQNRNVKLGSDLLDLVSKQSFNPLTIEPSSDVSFSDVSSVLSFGTESTDTFATKSESLGLEPEASKDDIEQELEHLEDLSMNSDLDLANVTAWELQDDNKLEFAASNKPSSLRSDLNVAFQEPTSLENVKNSVGKTSEEDRDATCHLDEPQTIPFEIATSDSSPVDDLQDDGSYTFEDLVIAASSSVNGMSSIRRSSARSLGSTRSGLTELDVTAHTRYADSTIDEVASDIPSDDLATDVMSTRSGVTDLDTTTHRSSFVAEKLEVGPVHNNEDANDLSEDGTSAMGSDNSSMAALQELMQIIGQQADQDVSANEGSDGAELEIEESQQDGSVDELQELMNIMDIDDGANITDHELGGDDLDLYAQAFADRLLYENNLKLEGREALTKYASDRSMSLRMSTRSISTSGLHDDSLVFHLLNSEGDMKEPGDRGSVGSGCWGDKSINYEEQEFKKEFEDTYSPNRPHPSLEYPPLYFLLRRFPWLFDNIKVLYLLRWRMSYPLQRRLPYSRSLRKVGINLTWGELLLLLPFFTMLITGIMYTFAIPSVKVSGKVARFGLIGALLFAQRNSVVTLLIGMPLDRSIFYHKLSGRLAGLTGLLHTLAFFLDSSFREKHNGDALGGGFDTTVNASGSMIMLMMIGIIASSIQRIRRKLFEVFYYLHLFFAVGMVVSAYFHSGVLIPCLTAAVWGVDLFIRSVVMARTRYPRKANLSVVSETVVEVSFPKTAGFCYNPGQYIYISIPEISWLQWHPFSISSSPKQKTVTLHIRVAGQWTSDLYQLARKSKEVSMLLEGPYGNVGVDILSDRKYKRIMLISGGIGLTPMQSVCEQLLYEKAKQRRDLESLKFIWIERDPVLMQEAEFIRRTSSIGSIGSLDVDDYLSSEGSMGGYCLDDTDVDGDEQKPTRSVFLNRQGSGVNEQLEQFIDRGQSINIASQLLALLPPGKTTDEELNDLYESQHLDMSQRLDCDVILEEEEADLNDSEDPEETKRSSIMSIGSVVDDETSFAENSAPWLMESQPVAKSLADVLDLQVYLTGNAPTMSGIPFARTGRPDMNALFQEEKNAAIATKQRKIAVLVSAPIKVQELCRKACLLYSDEKVRFDFHSECMGM